MDLVIEGKYVTQNGVKEGQIGIQDGIISKISNNGISGKRLKVKGLIFPGFIDPHVHLREPGWDHKEDFSSGSYAAINGGVTTVMDMPNNKEPADNVTQITKKMDLSKKSPIDIMFFGMASKNEIQMKKMRDLVVGYKIYMSETTGTSGIDSNSLEDVINMIPKGSFTSFHCEDGKIIESDSSRPEDAETLAIKNVIDSTKNENLKVNICHLSTHQGLEMVRKSKVMCEATPIHAFFNRGHIGKKGNMIKLNPPVRDSQNQKEVLNGLINGGIDFLATDHAPHTVEEKNEGAAGCPGLDTYGNFVSYLIENGASPQRILEITSSNISSVLGLKKGQIKEGYIADLTVIEMKGTKILNSDMKTKCGWTPFDGITMPGRVSTVVKDGNVLKHTQ